MKRILFFLLTVLPMWSFGIEPVVFTIVGQATYTVPEGKILLIETIAMGYDSNGYPGSEASLNFLVGNQTNRASFFSLGWANGICRYVSFSRPLKIPALSSISNQGQNAVVVFGLLATQEDLYAHIDGRTEGAICQNGNFSFNVLAASPRPASVGLQGSTDLSGWHAVPNAVVAKTDTDTYSISVPTDGQRKYFIKYRLNSVAQ